MELEFLKRIVKEAAKLIDNNYEVYKKGNDYDMVTNLDLKIEKYLIAEIKKKYPTFNIVSEEYNTDNKITENSFIIDPIDGTVNFINNIPLWGIQIACVKKNKTIASVIYLPKLNELYHADEKGAYLNDKKISIKEVPLKNALYVLDGNHNSNEDCNIIKEISKITNNPRFYSAMCVSYSLMARGSIHGVVFKADRVWDYMPGLYLCKMAGAKIKSIDGFHAAAMNEEFLNILEDCVKHK